MAKVFPAFAIFYSITAAVLFRTTPEFLCEHSIKTGHLSFTDASFLTARSLENTISKRWPKFTDETRHLPSWASPSATGGKQSAAFLFLRGGNNSGACG